MKVKQNLLTSDYYCFSVDEWTREYRFGVNEHKWEMSPGHYDERDCIYVAGRLRSTSRRKIDFGEAHILPSFVPRTEHEHGADWIGNLWMKSGRLFCSAFIPSDVYFSLPPVLAENRIVEMEWRVAHAGRGKGQLLSLSLESAESNSVRERSAFRNSPLATLSTTHSRDK